MSNMKSSKFVVYSNNGELVISQDTSPEFIEQLGMVAQLEYVGILTLNTVTKLGRIIPVINQERKYED